MRVQLALVLTWLLASTSVAYSEATPPGASDKLTLEMAVKRALANSPDALNAREKIVETDALIGQAFSTVLPTFGFTGSITHKKDPLNTGNPLFGGEPYNSYDARFTLDQPLFRSGALVAGIGAAKQETQVQKLNLDIAERDLTISVIQAFYSVLLQETQVKTLIEQQGVDEELLKIARDRVRTGRSRRLEVLQIQTNLALLIPQILQAKNQLQIDAAQLSNLMGEREARSIQVYGSLDMIDWRKIQASQDKTATQIPEIVSNSVSQEELENKRTVLLSTNWPSLDAVGTWGRSSYVRTDLLDAYSTYWTMGVQLQIPIFSGLSSIYQRRQISSQQAQLRISREKLEDDFSLSQVTAKKNLELAVAKVDSSATALQLATEAQILARREYRYGTTDYIQLTDIENSFISSEFGYEQARYDALSAQAQYFKAFGWPIGEFVRQATSRAQ